MDSESCYGHFCDDCEKNCQYYESCKYYTKTPQEIRALGLTSLDAMKNDCYVITDTFSTFALDDFVITPKEIKNMLAMLNALDSYTLEILANIIINRITLTQLAKKRQISKQSLHRKIVNIARKHPWLISCLEMLFFSGSQKLYVIKKKSKEKKS